MMKDVSEFKGLNGQIASFKNEVEDAEKITYIGSPGVCNPIAELLSYAVRDKENHFIPLLNIDDAHEFEFKSYGMVLNDEVSNPKESDVIVLLGGLTIPKYHINLDELNSLIGNVLKDEGKIIGVCFMDVFTKANWLDKIGFDTIIDASIYGTVKK